MSSSGLLAIALCAISLVACDKGMADPHEPTATPTPRPGVTPAATLTLTSVTFADDCGGTPPPAPGGIASVEVPATPAAPSSTAAGVAAPAVADVELRRCEQTSMQLSIVARRPTEVRVKSVEVYDESGKKLGELEARSPTRWSDAEGSYRPWDQTVATGQTALVSYVLPQPSFLSPFDARDRTYTVKVVGSVGGLDQPLQTTVMVVAQPPPVPT